VAFALTAPTPPRDSDFEPKTYHLFAVYLTHGLTGDQGYQLSHGNALPPVQVGLTASLAVSHTQTPVQFLVRTGDVARKIVSEALSKRAFILCCGHPFRRPAFVQELHRWINR
jgi:hypothetical protein